MYSPLFDREFDNFSQVMEYQGETLGEKPAFIYLKNGEHVVRSVSFHELSEASLARSKEIENSCAYNDTIFLIHSSTEGFIPDFCGALMSHTIPVIVAPTVLSRDGQLLARLIDSMRPTLIVCSSDLPRRVKKALSALGEHSEVRYNAVNESTWRVSYIGSRKNVLQTNVRTAFVQLSSGSTGLPKGIAISDDNVMHNVEAIRSAYEADQSSVGLCWLPHYHDMGLVGNILHPIYVGLTNYFMTPFSFMYKPSRWLNAITRFGVTITGGPDFAYEIAARKANNDQLDLSSWNVAYCGGDFIRRSTIERFTEKFSRSGFRSKSFLFCYGLAENTLMVTCADVQSEPEFHAISMAEEVAAKTDIACSGTPAQGIAVDILSDGRKCGDCELGEIFVSGSSLSPSAKLGYDKVLDKSVATGDMGFWKEGALYVVGRKDARITVRGENIHCNSVEARISSVLENEGRCALLQNRSTDRLTFVVESGRTEPTVGVLDQLRDIVTTILSSEFGVGVDQVLFVRSGVLPVTSSGKLKRFQILQDLESGRFGVHLQSGI